MRISLPPARYGRPEQKVGFYTQLLERAQSLPGVESATVVSPLPFTGEGNQTTISIQGRPVPPGAMLPLLNHTVASEAYFRTMRIPLLAGRTFTTPDDTASDPVAIVDQIMARRFWPNEDALGKRFKLGRPESPGAWITVVGVAGDIKRTGLAGGIRGEFHVPFQQGQPLSMTLVVRTASGPSSLVAALRRQVQAIDTDQPVYSVRTMESLVDASVSRHGSTRSCWGFLPAWRWRWRRWGSTALWRTSSRSSGTKSASAWRSERARATC